MKKNITIFIFSFVVSSILLINFTVSEFNQSKVPPKKPSQGKKDNPYGAAEFRYDMIRGSNESINPLARKKAIEFTKDNLMGEKLNKTSTISNWSALGPGNIGGRIRSILIRPSNTNHILVGAVAGGIWKSTDGGSSWTAMKDDGNPLSIGSMVNDGDVVYAGTGEGWGNVDAVYGGGIWKSTDFGDTWTLLSSTTSTPAQFRNVLRMDIDPSGNVYAVTKAYNSKHGVGVYTTDGGLFKSSDAGISWSKISSTDFATNYFNGCDIISISSSTILFAVNKNNSTYGGIYRTTDSGTNWSLVASVLPTTGYRRIALVQDPSNSNTVYAAYQSENTGSPDYGLKGIYKTTDGGATWTQLSDPPTLASTSSRSYLNTQGWYDNVIAVDPHNSSNLYAGGVDMVKSTDGGSSWSQLTFWHSSFGTPVVHADHHVITFDPNTANVVYGGNDGGIYKTTNGGATWTNLNNGLEITQYYGGAVAASGTNYQGGTQDNGHHKYDGSGTNWTEVKGGDGGYAEIDQSNPLVAYEEYVYLDIAKTTNGGSSWSDVQNGLTDAQNSSACLFIAPFSMNPENSNVLIAGSDNSWLTTDAAANWSSSSSTLSSGAKVSAVAAVNSASPYLGFAGTTDGKVFKCTSMTGTGDTWTEITPPSNNGAYVRRITVDLNDKNKIYVCYSGYNNSSGQKHIWYSSDQGANWSDISTGLPDVPVHSLVIDNNDDQKLYIGTETGVYQTSDRGTSWSKAGSGMPDYIPVDQLVIQSSTNKLFAFTHGRSVFVTNSALPVELTSFSSLVEGGNVKLNWETKTEVNNYGFEVERKLETEGWNNLGFVPGHGNSNSAKLYSFTDNFPTGGSQFSYRLKQIDIDGSFEYSDIIETEINIESFQLAQNFPNPFNPTTIIQYTVPHKSTVLLEVYDVLGKEVSTLVNEDKAGGSYEVNFNANNISSGIYYYTLKAGSFTETKKMFLLQ